MITVLFLLCFPTASCVDAAPRVTVTQPADGAVLPAMENFRATAEAVADSGRTISKVEFVVWSHNLQVGESSSAPFWVEVVPRDFYGKSRFSLVARATDSAGESTDSEPIWLTMTDDAAYPPRVAPREERLISSHVAGSGHEGIPCLAELPDGDLLCVFYAGRYELSDDTAIYLSRLAKGKDRWSEPRRVIGKEDGVPRVNPVLLTHDGSKLTCFYSKIEGGRNFEYARPYSCVSLDRGETWGDERPMPEPAFEHPTGTLFAIKPLTLADGTILLPANREREHPDPSRGWSSFFYRSEDGGGTWEETAELFSKPGNIQPTVQQLADGSLVALFRPRGPNSKLWRSTSDDGGLSWSPLHRTSVDNPSSRSDFVVLPSGAMLLACNPTPRVRSPVSLLLSYDDGKTWPVQRAIETGPGPYGYCSVLLGSDGRVHVAYDCDRRTVKHVEIDEAWFDEPVESIPYDAP